MKVTKRMSLSGEFYSMKGEQNINKKIHIFKGYNRNEKNTTAQIPPHSSPASNFVVFYIQ